METIGAIIFLACAGIIISGKIAKYFVYGEFDFSGIMGWICATIWCINATWLH